MNACDKYLDLISASLDGELNGADRADLEEHLSSCADCRRLSEAFSAISGSLAEDEKVPDNFTSGTMNLINSEAEKPQGIRRFFSLYGRYTGLAAALVILLLAGSSIKLGLSGGSTAKSTSAPAVGFAANGYSVSASGTEEEAYPETMISSSAVEQFDCASDSYDEVKSDSCENSMVECEASPAFSSSNSILSAEDICKEYGYEQSFYSISYMSAPAPELLSDCELLFSSDECEHYLVPIDIILQLEEEAVFTEIIYDMLSAEYGLVIVEN